MCIVGHKQHTRNEAKKRKSDVIIFGGAFTLTNTVKINESY